MRHRYTDNANDEKFCYDKGRVKGTKCSFLYTDFYDREKCLSSQKDFSLKDFYHLMGLISGNFTKQY